MTTRRPGIGALIFAWTGAAAFVASLLVFLYLYGIAYRRAAAPGPTSAAVLADVLLFSIFALHHSLLARPALKRYITRIVPAWLERSLYVWTASILFLLVCVVWRPVDGLLYAVPAPWRALGYLAQVTGIVMTLVSSSAIDMLDLAGVRQVLNARLGQSSQHAPLKTNGAYGFVRHPLYFGWTLLVFGAPDMTGTRAVFAIVSTLYLALAIPFEERSLVDVFGDGYRRYQQATRWRMIPGVW
jgi:protein-S-isoprenylcysteine O-methyltransferase Ste14